MRAEVFSEWKGNKTVNFCPKCQALAEKQSGCQHMICPVCKYEWCWVCGFSYKSVFHMIQFGSLACEMIGGIFLGNKSVCCRVSLFFTFTLLLPLLILLASFLIVGGGIVFSIEHCMKKCKRRKLLSRLEFLDKISKFGVRSILYKAKGSKSAPRYFS